MKVWRLTPRAEESLVDIALWTLETFGPRQAEIYETELLDRCAALAAGRAASRDCSSLLDPDADAETDLRYARAGEHFMVFIDTPDELVILDILHGRSDLPARIAAIQAQV
ncbi:MAG: plasmid stabilization system protein ParE [Limimaricola cinnabarinus]|jgi:plasmid stabilization system protein ParE|uniref:type II toxin-antitoxin system RelE/ParE family toxin n=1 Tax=Limimaricola cinnabarinus TaxID=1125964 RepID=UPI0039E50647